MVIYYIKVSRTNNTKYNVFDKKSSFFFGSLNNYNTIEKNSNEFNLKVFIQLNQPAIHSKLFLSGKLIKFEENYLVIQEYNHDYCGIRGSSNITEIVKDNVKKKYITPEFKKSKTQKLKNSK